MLKYRREFRRFHKSIWGAVALLILLGFLLQNVAGSVYYSLLMQSSTAVSSPPVELQEGTAGNSTIYTNGTSALVSTVAPALPPTYNPNNYNVVTGAHLSGSVPASVQTVDSDYFIVRSSGTANSTTAYNPSGYNLLGNTTLVSGTTSDLISNDGVYMTFRSYDSATSAQTVYAHQENTTIGGSTYYLLKRSSADAAGTTLSADAGTTGRKLMGKFAYQLTGVSSIPASTWTIYYRAYKGQNLIDAHGDVDILVRMSNGTVRTTIATNVANSGALTISWSTLSGTYSWAAYTVVNQTDYLEIDYYIEVTVIKAGFSVYLRIDDNILAVADQTRATNIYLPSEYTSEVEFTGSSNTYTWAQLVWTIDSAWNTGSVTVTIQVYNYTLGEYPTSGNGYDSYVSSATANTDETKTQTITINPQHFRDGSGNWKIKVKGVKSTTTQFDFKVDWVEFKPSHYTEYTVSTELLFSNMTENTPTQLNFTVVSQYNITNVNVTIQVWNYSLPSGYVTSGEGYLNYTSSGSNETKLLSINTNPQFYTSNGNAKIKITGMLSTTTQYQQETNQVKLLYNYSSSPDYDYVLKVVNKDPDAWKIRLKAYNDVNKDRLDNCTIYFYGTQSQPITNMNFTSNATGWSSAHSYNGTTGPELTFTEVTWDSGNGNPSPGSAGGSAYGGASESHSAKYWGTIIYNFSYTFTAPESGWTSVEASFAWKFTASGTYTNNKLNAVKLLLTDNSDVVLEELYVDNNGGSGWTGQASVGYYYRTDITVSASMTAGNSYKLKVQFVDTDTTGSDTPSVTFRIDDVGITFNYGNSNQIIIISGSYTQQTGPWYDLAASDTIYIAMHVETSSSDTSYIYTYLEIRVPNTTVYAQYIITFKIT